MNLLEAYKGRLAISEQVYARSHGGSALDNARKLATAKCLENTNKFINEAFANSVGTQRSDLGAFKKFALNLTTVALPNLISHDLVIVYPMSSLSGYITYLQYVASSNKGATKQGDVFNDPFHLGGVDSTYTSSSVVEAFTGDGTKKEFTVMWTPVESIAKVTVDGTEVTGSTFDAKTGVVTLATAPASGKEVKIAYVYDNVVIPQNDLPVVGVKMQSLPLLAHARRVAIYYSQIAAFQAKTDYGFDLGDQLAEKAVGQLSYEIDTEVTNLLIDNATVDTDLTFDKTLPVGVNKADHYESFMEIIEIAKQKIYDKTKRFAPNYMLIASNVLPVLTFIKAWRAAPAGKINGPYFAGTLGSLKVYVTPNIAAGKFVLGVNGDDMMSSAAVYAPYMPVVPTQLLQYADGGTSQGWSTLYDLKMLNPDLLIAGSVVESGKSAIFNTESNPVYTKVAA
jgi:hypothetical protein